MDFSKIDPERNYSVRELIELTGLAQITILKWVSLGNEKKLKSIKTGEWKTAPLQITGKDFISFMKKKVPDISKIQPRKNYTYEEIKNLLGITVVTLRTWTNHPDPKKRLKSYRSGIIRDPHKILGQDLIDYLNQKSIKGSIKLPKYKKLTGENA